MTDSVYVVVSGECDGSSILKCFVSESAAETFALNYIRNITRRNKFKRSYIWTRRDCIFRHVVSQWVRDIGSGRDASESMVFDRGPTWVCIERHRLDTNEGHRSLEHYIRVGMGKGYELDWKFWTIQLFEHSFHMHMEGARCILSKVNPSGVHKEVWSWDHKPTSEDLTRDFPVFSVHEV